jgi:hypothetical protein
MKTTKKAMESSKNTKYHFMPVGPLVLLMKSNLGSIFTREGVSAYESFGYSGNFVG